MDLFPSEVFGSWLNQWASSLTGSVKRLAASAALKDMLALLEEAPSLDGVLPSSYRHSSSLILVIKNTITFIKEQLVPHWSRHCNQAIVRRDGGSKVLLLSSPLAGGIPSSIHHERTLTITSPSCPYRSVF